MSLVDKALWFIESHFGEPLTLDAVAEASGVSRFHLARSFGLATGHSVAGYWRARRLSEAAKTLAAGAPDIMAVALDAGYGSHEAFTRAFRDRFGQTPDAVRARGALDDLALTEPIRMPATDTTPDFETPRTEARDAMQVAGLKRFFLYSDTAGIPVLWPRFHPFIGTLGKGEAADHAFGVCMPVPGRDDGFDYMACVELRGSASGLPTELAVTTLPATTYVVFRHPGHVSGIQATCNAIFERWLPQFGCRPAEGPVSMIEHYGPDFDPHTGLGGLDIWIPVAKG